MTPQDPEFSRSLGFFSEAEQQRFIDSTVVIAGAGGDGGMFALQMARLGVGEIRLADPDPFEAENINRQACCTTKTIGENKATAVANYIRDINPKIKVLTYTDGVTVSNVQEFMRGADLLVDETEFTLHALGIMLARQARAQKIPNLMALNLGFGTLVTSYGPKGKTLESVLGLSETASLDEIAQLAVPLNKWLPFIPKYGDMKVFEQVAAGNKSAPSVAPGVAIAAGTAAVQATLHLLGNNNHREKPVFAPRSLSIDAMTGKSRVIKHPTLSFYSSIARMAARSKLGLNPQTSY